MPDCTCPICGQPFTVPSSLFGVKYRCSACGSEYLLDIKHPARYELPSIIRIQFHDSRGDPFAEFRVPVMVEYGYHLPPLLSNSQGQTIITREMFRKAQRDEISTGIMDHKDDFALNRFVRIKVPARMEAIKVAEARSGSGWPILDFEKELYGNLPPLLQPMCPARTLLQ
jgi:hypothetical protein